MSYKKYADGITALAVDTRTRLAAAASKLDRAEQNKREHPERSRYSDDMEIAKVARARVEYMDAQAAMNKLQTDAPNDARRRIAELRRELKAEVDAAFGARAADVDAATVALLDSGILTPAEYVNLATGATPTMKRMIAAHAMKRAEAEESKGHIEAARDYRASSYAADSTGGAAIMDAFDCAAEILTRCVDNAAMFDCFESLAKPFLDTLNGAEG